MFPTLHTLNFEAPEDPSVVEAGGEADPLDYDSEPEWTGPSQEEWQQVLQTNQMLQEAMTSAYAPPGQEPGQPGIDIPDPYADPEGYREWLFDQIDQRTAPIAGYQEQLQTQEGKEVGMDKLDELQQSQGEFLYEQSRAEAYSRAERYFPEMVARFGDTPKAADAALAKGYKEQKQYEDAVGQAFHDKKLNELATLGGAPREMPAAGAQGAQNSEIPKGDEMAIVGKYFQG